jgi:hypothetical protein
VKKVWKSCGSHPCKKPLPSVSEPPDLRNLFPAGKAQLPLLKVVRVNLNISLPLLGNLVIRKNGFHGTLWNTRSTVNTFFGIDVKLSGIFEFGFITPGMDTIHGARLNASSILGINARLSDYERHPALLLFFNPQELNLTKSNAFCGLFDTASFYLFPHSAQANVKLHLPQEKNPFYDLFRQ